MPKTFLDLLNDAVRGGSNPIVFSDEDVAALQKGKTNLDHEVSVLLSHAAFSAAGVTPVELVRAQGANTVIIPIYCLFVSNFTVGYTAIEDYGTILLYPNGATQTYWAALFRADPATALSDFLAATGEKMTVIPTPMTNYSSDFGSTYPNFLTAATSAFTGQALNLGIFQANGQLLGSGLVGGNAANTLRVVLTYRVLNLTTGQYQ